MLREELNRAIEEAGFEKPSPGNIYIFTYINYFYKDIILTLTTYLLIKNYNLIIKLIFF